jgi:hypothetical protein
VISETKFAAAAAMIGCHVEAIRAVCDVEAPKGGFNPDGSVVTLFEGHKFFLYTKGAYATTDPDLCYKAWTKKWYGKTWRDEQDRLKRAMALSYKAALMSASWGKFQIMGFNFALCGFTTVEVFVERMKESEDAQLDAFVQYVIHTGLSDELQRLDWAGFAMGYNGRDFRANKYDIKLADEYRRECGL